jgi:hypothetical protein
VEGVLEACGKAAADDLLDAALLTRTGGDGGLGQQTRGFFLGKAAGGHQTTQRVRGPVEGVGETRALADLSTNLYRGQNGPQEALRAVLAASCRQDGLLGAWRHRTGGRDVRGGQVSGALQLLGEPAGERSGLTDVTDDGVRALLRGGARSNDVSAVSPDVDLPGEGTAGTRPGGALPAPVVGSPVPDVEAAGGRSHTEGGLVVSWARPTPERGQDRERVEAVGQPREVYVLCDGDSRQDAVAAGGLVLMGIDVDDDETCGTAGDTDAEVGP